jgi:hypothetical protein
VGKKPGAAEGPCRITVRITAFRQRLLDPDNLCAKSLVDGLRYAGLIPEDRPQDIELIVLQYQCDRKEERTEIELFTKNGESIPIGSRDAAVQDRAEMPD